MTTLVEWARDWGVPDVAVLDLRYRMGVGVAPVASAKHPPWSEARAAQELRLEAAEQHILLFRNNVGALQDEDGRWVRYGLANDSTKLNEQFKSADYIGLRANGQFVSREVKAGDWKWTGTERELAQLRWADLILASGGDAGFATGRGTL